MEIFINLMKLIFLRNINRIEEYKNHIFFQQKKEKQQHTLPPPIVEIPKEELYQNVNFYLI